MKAKANYIVLVWCLALFLSCQTNITHTQYTGVQNGKWAVNDTISFSFTPADTTSVHHLFLQVRNDNSYPFSNLFLITKLGYPTGEVETDTLEYAMALPDGSWLGTGAGSIKESKLWHRENIVFPNSGVYTLEVIHAMRKNGKTEGVSVLEGILDVGYQIEKSN